MKNKLIALVALGLLTVACVEKHEPQQTVQSGNFQVEYLFENQGCKAYRFLDGGRYIYYTDCSGKTEYDYTVTTRAGKTTTTRTEHVQNSTSK